MCVWRGCPCSGHMYGDPGMGIHRRAFLRTFVRLERGVLAAGICMEPCKRPWHGHTHGGIFENHVYAFG